MESKAFTNPTSASVGPFPIGTRLELLLTLVAFPPLWLLYVGTTHWSSIEAALAAPAEIILIYIATELLVATGSKHWPSVIPSNPVGLRLILRPCAWGYGVACILAPALSFLRFIVRVVCEPTGD